MKVDELKQFLRLRGLKISGRKEELVARVFVALENNVPVVKTAEEVESEIANEYKAKLNFLNGDQIPDPFKLDKGWLDEEEGIRYWPVTLYMDIFNFLAFHPNELASSDLSDYKTSKAYSYFSQGWLAPLHFNNINGNSKVCLLMGSCKPSQRINDPPHKLWICLEKQSGKILRSHCTCMAGLSQTCNHVAAALFRIESASRLGLNNPSCTSAACTWLPNNKTVEPVKIRDLKLKRENFGKRGKKETELNSMEKKRFNPIAKCSYKLDLTAVASALRTVCKDSDSILFSALPKNDLRSVENNGSLENVETLDQILQDCVCKEDYLKKLTTTYTEMKIITIEKITRGQINNVTWSSFRKHAITASIAHDVNTRYLTLQKNASSSDQIDLTSIFHKIANENQINPDLPALKYGRNMEDDAIDTFFDIFKGSHKGARIHKCGLFLAKNAPFLGASPDRIIECSCCGRSCLEVKCPFSIRHTTPTDSSIKISFLTTHTGKLALNKNHKYYTQCQMQMASTQLLSNYFFVWTAHGHFLEKVVFNKENWQILQNNLTNFYINYYIPSLFD